MTAGNKVVLDGDKKDRCAILQPVFKKKKKKKKAILAEFFSVTVVFSAT